VYLLKKLHAMDRHGLVCAQTFQQICQYRHEFYKFNRILQKLGFISKKGI